MGSTDESLPAKVTRSQAEAEATEEEAFAYALLLTSGSVLPMILKAAIQLDVLEIIARSGPAAHLSTAEVAAQLPTRNPDAAVMLDRMFRVLAAYSVLTCSLRDGGAERLYGLAPVCKFLTRNSHGVSLAPLSLMNQDRVLMESWYHLKDAVLEGGIPFNRAYGMSAFEYPNTDPRFNRMFNRGMSDHSTLTMNRILETYDGFRGLRSLVDVGGGTGAVINMIVSKHPAIKGINFDLPHVIEDAPAYTGVEHVGGDMFADVPNADAIFMKWICHDWSDAHCLKFLRKCREAVPEDGKVIVAEFMLPESPDTSLATVEVVGDAMMLAYNPGGKERSRREFEGLASGAGFAGCRLACCAYRTWVMEFCKKLT